MSLALIVSIVFAANQSTGADTRGVPARDWAADHKQAAEAASRGDARGFDQLLSIVEADESAEYSEVSLELLECLLIKEPSTWFKAMGGLAPERVEAYVRSHGPVFRMPPWCVGMPVTSAGDAWASRDYLRRAEAGAKNYSGSSAEMKVRGLVLAELAKTREHLERLPRLACESVEHELEKLVRLKDSGGLTFWVDLRALFPCLEHSADEGSRAFVVWLLAERWDLVPELMRFAKEDPGFFAWVKSCPSDLTPGVSNRKIERNATRQCPAGFHYFCHELAAAAGKAAEASYASRGDMPPVIGVVEEQPRARSGPMTQVRVLFRKVSDGWEPVSAAGAPMQGSWTVCFDGKRHGFLETELERQTESALVGVHRPLPGEEVHFPGTRSNVFAGWLPGEVYRPMALSSHARCDDPARWRPAPIEGELWRKVAEDARGRMRAALCGGPNHDVRTGDWAPQFADLELLKSYASKTGERLVSLRARTPEGLCDFVEGPSPFGRWLFAISPTGEVRLLGVGLTVVDAGDYDGDGESEILAKLGGYNEDGYVLFWAGLRERLDFTWRYH